MRKASEILEELELKVNALLGYYKNMDNNLKLILDRLNNAQAQVKPIKEPVRPGRTNVTQAVLFKDSKPIAMAHVEITNEKGLVEKSTKTNAKGKWIASLSPGIYSVFISRKGEKFPIEIRSKIEVPEGTNVELDPAVLQ